MTDDTKTAHLHNLLLQVRCAVKYDSICFMLQDLHNRQSNTEYNSSGVPRYVEELAAEWPAYSGFASYPVRPAPYIKTFVDVREGFWMARRDKPCGWASMGRLVRACSTSSLKGLHHKPHSLQHHKVHTKSRLTAQPPGP